MIKPVDNRQLIDPNNREKFIQHISENVTVALLNSAILAADSRYLRADNASFVRFSINILSAGIPIVARWNRGDTYISHYNDMIRAGETSPQVLLAALLMGPPKALSSGGTGINSFKWILVEELAKLIATDLPEQTFEDEFNHTQIADSATNVIIEEMIEHLGGGQLRELKPSGMK